MARLAAVFFIAYGMTAGGVLFGGLAAVLSRTPPVPFMLRLAEDLKYWAVMAAVGGTITALRSLEEGVFGGRPGELLKGLALLGAAFLGAAFAAQHLAWAFRDPPRG
ncbi:MAG: hypothetical protein BLITH_0258 [Brockia lithotrophica]|uniref:Sporulation protein YtrH n=1 Tax=Brockia lithotrophica TaxID=933949 RepID=A0A2T5GAL3_9BACL|nr:sporulation protein [Brockia lithotrophica]MBT9253687.1 YtrH family sporulation protein [Brockia lithotrophica]PTQ53178.1 MAG: hypothetical protein BLITH_0258 [Brockia lithotrophica]